ncbi:hypothetical protein N9N67_03835 [Bacteriovoracaceae bacterium]|nr:hypothetical protein [Bacteriovoracaceae bacterium]
MTKKSVVRITHTLIFILHIGLLGWIFYVLKNGGNFSIEKSLTHFLGMSLFGGLLITGSAKVIKRLNDNNYYVKE